MRVAGHRHDRVLLREIEKLPRKAGRGSTQHAEMMLHVETHRSLHLIVPASPRVDLLADIAFRLYQIILDDGVTILHLMSDDDFAVRHILFKRGEPVLYLREFFFSKNADLRKTFCVSAARRDAER